MKRKYRHREWIINQTYFRLWNNNNMSIFFRYRIVYIKDTIIILILKTHPIQSKIILLSLYAMIWIWNKSHLTFVIIFECACFGVHWDRCCLKLNLKLWRKHIFWIELNWIPQNRWKLTMLNNNKIRMVHLFQVQPRDSFSASVSVSSPKEVLRVIIDE